MSSVVNQVFLETPQLTVVVVIASILGYFIGYLGFSFFFAVLLIPLFSTSFRTIFRRKALVKAIEEEVKLLEQRERVPESVEWLNRLLEKFWTNYSIFTAELIIEKANPILKQATAGILGDINLEKVNLGDFPPQLSNFLVHKAANDKLIFDADLYWPSDFSIRVAFTKAGIPATIKIANLKIGARARIDATLIPNPPFASIVHLQLLEVPDIDLDVRPVTDLCLLPGLDEMIEMTVKSTIKGMLVAPKYLEIDLAGAKAAENKVEGLKQAFKPKEGTGVIGGVASTVGDGLSSVGDAGLSAVKGVGNLGVSAVTGVGNIGMAGVKGVGSVGSSAVSGVGKLGKGVVGLASSPFGKKDKAQDRELEPEVVQASAE